MRGKERRRFSRILTRANMRCIVHSLPEREMGIGRFRWDWVGRLTRASDDRAECEFVACCRTAGRSHGSFRNLAPIGRSIWGL